MEGLEIITSRIAAAQAAAVAAPSRSGYPLIIKATEAPEVAWFFSPIMKACAAGQGARRVERRQLGRLGKTPPAVEEEAEEEVGDSSAAEMGAAANTAGAAEVALMEAEMAQTADLAGAAARERQAISVAPGAAAADLEAGAARLRMEQ